MIFSELDFRMSVIKRWSVVETLRKQSLAEHSYNVAVMARRLAPQIVGAMANDAKFMDYLTEYALFHDYAESVTGDFPSYMKPFVDEDRSLMGVPAFFNSGVDIESPPQAIRFLVKVADYIDACVFLHMEISLGNRSVVYHLRNLEQRFRNFLNDADIDGTKIGAGVYSMYETQVLGQLFGGNGQYVSEIDGFPKSS